MALAGEVKTDAKNVGGNQEPLNYKKWALRVSIHCEACKKKVNKILHKIEGEGKKDAKNVEGNQEPLNYKTWVLRVSIQCEACKKKLNKILHKIEGVYRTDIDLKQQTVTVTGDVEAEALISKLEKKMGKRPVFLLPDKAADKAAPKEKKQSKPKPKEIQHDSSNNSSGEGEAPKGNSKGEGKAETKEPVAATGAGGDSSSSRSGAREGKNGDVGEEAEEGKQPEKAKQSVTISAGDQSPPVPDSAVAEKVRNDEKRDGGVGGKKNQLKGQNGNNENSKEDKMLQEVAREDVPMRSERSPNTGSSRNRDPRLDPISHIPPHEPSDAYVYSGPYSQHYYHEPPAYTVNYHTTHPMTSYGASFYAPQAPPSSYAYAHPGPEGERALPYSDPYQLQPSDSFELFSDENPNACTIV